MMSIRMHLRYLVEIQNIRCNRKDKRSIPLGFFRLYHAQKMAHPEISMVLWGRFLRALNRNCTMLTDVVRENLHKI